MQNILRACTLLRIKIAASFKDQQKNRQQHTGRVGRRRGEDTVGSDQRQRGRQAIKLHCGAEGGLKKTSAVACRGRGGSSDGTGGRHSGRQRRW